jgi:hypothetical protein
MNKESYNLAKSATITPLTVAEQSNIKGGSTTCEEKRPRVRR